MAGRSGKVHLFVEIAVGLGLGSLFVRVQNEVVEAMATSILKVTNIPVYIAEPEFKRVWNQQGLECQSCNFVKGINGE